MIEVSLDTKGLEKFVNSTNRHARNTIDHAVGLAARRIKTQIVNGMSKVTKINKRDMSGRIRVLAEGTSSLRVVRVRSKWIPYGLLGMVETPAGVRYYDPIKNARRLAKSSPKTFIGFKKNRSDIKRRPVLQREGPSRLPLKAFKRVPTSEVYRKRIGDRLDPLYSALLTLTVAESVWKSFASGASGQTANIIIDRKQFISAFKKRIRSGSISL